MAARPCSRMRRPAQERGRWRRGVDSSSRRASSDTRTRIASVGTQRRSEGAQWAAVRGAVGPARRDRGSSSPSTRSRDEPTCVPSVESSGRSRSPARRRPASRSVTGSRRGCRRRAVRDEAVGGGAERRGTRRWAGYARPPPRAGATGERARLHGMRAVGARCDGPWGSTFQGGPGGSLPRAGSPPEDVGEVVRTLRCRPRQQGLRELALEAVELGHAGRPCRDRDARGRTPWVPRRYGERRSPVQRDVTVQAGFRGWPPPPAAAPRGSSAGRRSRASRARGPERPIEEVRSITWPLKSPIAGCAAG